MTVTPYSVHLGGETQQQLPKPHQQRQPQQRSELELSEGLCRTQCGSPAYAAPEVLSRQPYGLQADVWSVYVIASAANLSPRQPRKPS
ncbi:unnamed protein product [Protopolystoma xenopodis]|uniref:Protein kinase domain-containing protein n=1 Tax=Protopolystoma xenopodis TaxID=117903 RepID=A0A3S5BAU3_9PLAT|nr:unnamed protein product [Protopolystoma xenopodis]